MKKLCRNTAVAFASPLITIAAAFIVLLVLIFVFSRTPSETIYYFFAGPFTNKYYFGNMLNAAVPLILTGLGISFAFRSSVYNLGGEGQVYAGGFTATLVLLLLPGLPGPSGIVLAVFSAVIVSALIAGFSGFFRMKWGTDELISSFLISASVIYVVDYLITGVFNDTASNLLTTPAVDVRFWLTKIFPPSNLNSSVIIAVIAAAAAYFILFRTRTGYEMRICGLNPKFAAYGGINTGIYMVLPMAISGGFHGLAGSLSVLGTYHMSLKGFSGGIGWNGIAVALIAGNNPAAVVPAALFFAFIEAGAKSAMINSDITIEVATIAQAVIFFFITSKVIYNLLKYRRAYV